MRYVVLPVVLLFASPAAAAGPISGGTPAAPVAGGSDDQVSFVDVRKLEPMELDGMLVTLPSTRRLSLVLPASLSLHRVSDRDLLHLQLSPDVALASASLTLRLIPSSHAPDPAVPLVLLPRVKGVGSRWFGLDFAAWF